MYWKHSSACSGACSFFGYLGRTLVCYVGYFERGILRILFVFRLSHVAVLTILGEASGYLHMIDVRVGLRLMPGALALPLARHLALPRPLRFLHRLPTRVCDHKKTSYRVQAIPHLMSGVLS